MSNNLTEAYEELHQAGRRYDATQDRFDELVARSRLADGMDHELLLEIMSTRRALEQLDKVVRRLTREVNAWEEAWFDSRV